MIRCQERLSRVERAPRFAFGDHVVAAEVFDHRVVKARGDGEVEQHVRADTMLACEFVHSLFDAGHRLVLGGVGGVIVDALGEVGPFVIVVTLGELPSVVLEVFAEGGIAVLGATDAEHGEVFGHQAVAVQVVQRGDELALGEVTGSAEDDDLTVGGSSTCGHSLRIDTKRPF